MAAARGRDAFAEMVEPVAALQQGASTVGARDAQIAHAGLGCAKA